MHSLIYHHHVRRLKWLLLQNNVDFSQITKKYSSFCYCSASPVFFELQIVLYKFFTIFYTPYYCITTTNIYNTFRLFFNIKILNRRTCVRLFKFQFLWQLFSLKLFPLFFIMSFSKRDIQFATHIHNHHVHYYGNAFQNHMIHKASQ